MSYTWTDEEIAKLHEHGSRLTAPELAKRALRGRTARAIKWKRTQLGIAPPGIKHECDVGMVFGHLRVKGFMQPGNYRNTRCLCVCESPIHSKPVEHITDRKSLVAGRAKSCGCMMGHNITREEWFWANVDKRDATSCWLWTGGASHGYGCMTREDGSGIRSHVFSYELHKGNTGGLFVCHTCDLPLCVNPSHLFLGTDDDNKQDSVVKRRHTHGERHPQSKLSAQDARAIFESKEPPSVLAERYGVDATQISNIQIGKSWRIATGVADGAQPRKARSFLSREMVLKTKRMLRDGVSHKDIAEAVGTSRTTVGDINTGKTWKNVK